MIGAAGGAERRGAEQQSCRVVLFGSTARSATSATVQNLDGLELYTKTVDCGVPMYEAPVALERGAAQSSEAAGDKT